MKRAAFMIGLFLLPIAAETAGTYRMFYDELLQAISNSEPSEPLKDFIIEEMKTWNERGIRLTGKDIEHAIAGRLWMPDGTGLCQNKQPVSGTAPYTFATGGTGPGSSSACTRC